MVLVSMLRQTAAKRIPLIKFRRQREEETTAARTGSFSGESKGKSSSSPAAVCLLKIVSKMSTFTEKKKIQFHLFPTGN